MSETQANGLAGAAAAGDGGGPDTGDGGGPDTGGLPPMRASGATERRPEIAVGAAFAGGFLLALLLRRARS